MATDDLTLVLGGRKLSGWQEVRATLGIERCPSDFEIKMTERYPGETQSLIVQPQDPCQILLGSDPVITGYVDQFIPEYAHGEHSITVAGRSKSEDIVDCAAEWPGFMISASSAFEIAKKLCAPYGINVQAAVDTGPVIPQFPLNYGENAYAIIERIARYRGLLIYDLANGDITLAQAGNGQMASGLAEGHNIEKARALYSADQRYSTYEVLTNSIDTFADAGDGGFIVETVTDQGMNRHRQMNIIAETGDVGNNIAKQRGLWEAARRAGRSNVITATVDAWRDTGGKLWTPNYKIPVAAANLKAPAYDWVISEVSFRKDADGTHADLVIMPRQAFLPEPTLLLPFAKDVPIQ